MQPGSGPPMHVHHLQEETLTVERGTMGWQRARRGGASRPQSARRPSFAPGEAHRFWNAGDDELVCVGFIRPPDNVEYFLTKVFELTRANGGKRPRDVRRRLPPGRATAPSSGWRTSPAPVQRVVFPIVVGYWPALRAPPAVRRRSGAGAADEQAPGSAAPPARERGAGRDPQGAAHHAHVRVRREA